MKLSAGLLIYRRNKGTLEVLLVHPGGPFWVRKDAWGIPKGLYDESEDPLAAAKREFLEETGQQPPTGEYIELGEVKASSGKIIKAWAAEGEIDTDNVVSNTMPMEWPPKSGQQIDVPEIDKAKWFDIAKAGAKMHKGQEILVERLAEKLDINAAKEHHTPSQSSLF